MSERIKFTSKTRKSVYAKYDGHCAICGNPVKYNDMTIDHIKPLSKGGTNEMENLELACGECNRMKNSMELPELFGKSVEIIVHNWREIIKLYAKRVFANGGAA